MRKYAKLAAVVALALPLMGFAGAGTAQARDGVTFSLSLGTQDVRWDRDRDSRYDGGDRYDRDDRYDDDRGDRYGRNRALSARQIRNSVLNSYAQVLNIAGRGDFWLVRVYDHSGRDLLLKVDSYSGQVFQVYRTEDTQRRGYRNRDRDRWN